MAREAETRPAWIEAMEVEDLEFLRRFLLSSGSLKDLAGEYQVSYPTIRSRLDRLIAKVQAAEDPEDQRPVRSQAADPGGRRCVAAGACEGAARGPSASKRGGKSDE